jgi:hypothetical protein
MYMQVRNIIIFCLIFFFSFSLAASVHASDCWGDYMIDQMSVCSHAHMNCSADCVPIKDHEESKACFASCMSTLDTCYSSASAAYSVCVHGGSVDEGEVGVLVAEPLEEEFGGEEEVAQVEEVEVVEVVEEEPESELVAVVVVETESEHTPALQTEREVIEWLKSGLEIYGSVNDFKDFYKNGEFDAYSKLSLGMDVGNGFIVLMDLLNKGVSFEDALTKATLDTGISSAFMLIPLLNVADLAATVPDAILKQLGFDEDGSVRAFTHYLSEHSPSSFIELSTEVMIETGTWTNVVGALRVAIDDVVHAEGGFETLKQTGKFFGTVVGAMPVAIAMEVRDTVGAVVSLGKSVVGAVGDWLTN